MQRIFVTTNNAGNEIANARISGGQQNWLRLMQNTIVIINKLQTSCQLRGAAAPSGGSSRLSIHDLIKTSPVSKLILGPPPSRHHHLPPTTIPEQPAFSLFFSLSLCVFANLFAYIRV